MIQQASSSTIRTPGKRQFQAIAGSLLAVLALSMAAHRIVSAQETVKGGNLNDKALQLPVPIYPATAKAARVTGEVVVQVVVTETGKVESAKPASGPAMLRQAAADAARRAKFAPLIKSGAPVKIEGTLSYTFKL